MRKLLIKGIFSLFPQCYLPVQENDLFENERHFNCRQKISNTCKSNRSTKRKNGAAFNPFPDTPILGSSDSAVNKDVTSE